MKMERAILSAILLLLLLDSPLVAAPKKPSRKAAPVKWQQYDRQLQELLALTRQAGEQAQAEARRAREQNETLQQKLEENTREMVALRQAMADLKSQMTNLQMVRATADSEKGTVPDSSASAAAQAMPTTAKVQNEPSGELPPRNSPDAIAEKIERLQEQVEVHAAQIREHAQTKVESDSKFRVRLSGTVLMNAFLNSNDASLNDVPLVAPFNARKQKNNFGATLRQTMIGLTMDGPRLSEKLGSARLSAQAEFDFWGGRFTDVLGVLRVVTASARLDWEKTSLVVGQRPPLVAPRNPTSMAAVWLAPLAGAGNLWEWHPQIMVEHRVKAGEFSELAFQGGMMMPFGETFQGTLIEGPPGWQSRVLYRRNLDSDRTVEFGVGGYVHRRPFAGNRHVNSFAVTTDWNIPLGDRIALSGEAYHGRAIRIGEEAGDLNDRLYALTGPLSDSTTRLRGVSSSGGWMQMAIRARDNLDFNFAYGQDDPNNRDIFFGLSAASLRLKNQVTSANFIWQLRQSFLFSAEMRRLWTDYATVRRTGNHYNVAFGYTF
jgi:flagellar biosynthesis chaperone FliJ